VILEPSERGDAWPPELREKSLGGYIDDRMICLGDRPLGNWKKTRRKGDLDRKAGCGMGERVVSIEAVRH